MFKELRNDYYDEDKGCYVIDGWVSDDDNEPGIIVAEVYPEKVIYMKEEYENLPEVIEVVKETKEFFHM